MNNYIILNPTEDFSFRIPNPDYINVNDYLNKNNSNEIELIQELIELKILNGKNIIVFKTQNKIGILGKSFTGWSINISNEKEISLSLFDSISVNEINILNMHPAKGTGYGTISFSNEKTIKEMLIFFIDSNYEMWDNDFKKSEKYVNELKKILCVEKVNSSKGFNC